MQGCEMVSEICSVNTIALLVSRNSGLLQPGLVAKPSSPRTPTLASSFPPIESGHEETLVFRPKQMLL